MFCPRCAAQNLDNAKFCRGCGTNIEIVALALSGEYPTARKSENGDDREPPSTWLEKRREGVRSMVKASGLLGSSLLIGLALGLFSNEQDWIIIWMVFAGWMATWGVFSLVSGINSLIDSRFVRKQMLEYPGAPAQPLRAHESESLSDGMATPTLSVPRSVTEHTTKSLSEQRPSSK